VVIVEGSSMEPSLHDGDRVLAHRRPPQPIARGDVIVVERPDGYHQWNGEPPARLHRSRGWMIKRVAAAPGDAVPDGIPVSDRVVPPRRFVLLGDNGAKSYDSRLVGYFPAERILGVFVRRMSRHDDKRRSLARIESRHLVHTLT
jgi:signal peptidase I